uniref:Uncharacterized protein n=1 Tax=Romanomermis culicivorax TaxID=13658 RepID=A0A915KDJ1_ROMCU
MTIRGFFETPDSNQQTNIAAATAVGQTEDPGHQVADVCQKHEHQRHAGQRVKNSDCLTERRCRAHMTISCITGSPDQKPKIRLLTTILTYSCHNRYGEQYGAGDGPSIAHVGHVLLTARVVVILHGFGHLTVVDHHQLADAIAKIRLAPDVPDISSQRRPVLLQLIRNVGMAFQTLLKTIIFDEAEYETMVSMVYENNVKLSYDNGTLDFEFIRRHGVIFAPKIQQSFVIDEQNIFGRNVESAFQTPERFAQTSQNFVEKTGLFWRRREIVIFVENVVVKFAATMAVAVMILHFRPINHHNGRFVGIFFRLELWAMTVALYPKHPQGEVLIMQLVFSSLL